MGSQRHPGMPPPPAQPPGTASQAGVMALGQALLPLLVLLLLPLLLVLAPLSRADGTALAAPGVCVGPVCADQISRSAKLPWQLRLRVDDQLGHRERLLVDCRDGTLSPLSGTVDRRYAGAVARRLCRLVG